MSFTLRNSDTVNNQRQRADNELSFNGVSFFYLNNRLAAL